MARSNLIASTRIGKRRTPATVIAFLIVGVTAVLTLLPAAIILSGSLTDNQTLVDSGYRPWPRDLSIEAYRFVAKDPAQLQRSYLISTVVSVLGSAIGLTFSAMLAYSLSRKIFTLRRLLIFLVFFTLLFRAGVVPLYILMVRTLHLKDTIWALILPGVINPWFVLLLRAFIVGLPSEFYDAAKMDGAGEFTIFSQIAVPLSKPALATIGMFFVLAYWNDWFTPLLFIDSADLTPLQYMLHRMMENVVFLQRNMHNLSSREMAALPSQSLRMAMAVIAAGPMTMVFLFFQRYFVRGLTLGGLKG